MGSGNKPPREMTDPTSAAMLYNTAGSEAEQREIAKEAIKKVPYGLTPELAARGASYTYEDKMTSLEKELSDKKKKEAEQNAKIGAKYNTMRKRTEGSVNPTLTDRPTLMSNERPTQYFQRKTLLGQ